MKSCFHQKFQNKNPNEKEGKLVEKVDKGLRLQTHPVIYSEKIFIGKLGKIGNWLWYFDCWRERRVGFEFKCVNGIDATVVDPRPCYCKNLGGDTGWDYTIAIRHF